MYYCFISREPDTFDELCFPAVLFKQQKLPFHSSGLTESQLMRYTLYERETRWILKIGDLCPYLSLILRHVLDV